MATLSQTSQFINSIRHRITSWQDRSPRIVFLLPAVLFVLFLSIFPLITSLYLSFARVQFVRGGIEITFVGLRNYEKLILGSEQRHFLGRFGELSIIQWGILLAAAGLLLYWLYHYLASPNRSIVTALVRLVAAMLGVAILWVVLSTLSETGLPGTMVVTLIFVFTGVALQYLIGLGLAMLLVQNLPGKRFFRIIFLLPMMITPVGIAFLFRMLTDTFRGPFAPLWMAAGLANFSWVDNPFSARAAILIGDIWQWTPFMFIVLLAALEGVAHDQIEAALVDGANRLQLFRHIILPQIAPVSLTVILIRMIEAFKIIDIPRVLTGGGPGTATESLTLHAYYEWRSPNLGGSAAISYLLLILVTYLAVMYVNTIRQQILKRL